MSRKICYGSRRPSGRTPNGSLELPREYNVVRALVLLILGGKCVRCGFSDLRALHLDHVESDGASSRKAGENWLDRAKEILNGSERFQILCANCNEIKKHEELKYFDVSADVEKLKQTLTMLMNDSVSSS